MTDLEIKKLCAQAIGFASIRESVTNPVSIGVKAADWHEQDSHQRYNPLHDDAQVMALVKEFDIQIEGWSGDRSVYILNAAHFVSTDKDDLNRAIVECVAKMQAAI